MKIIRNWVTLASLSVVVFALCATGARAQGLSTTHFAGTFTLPFAAQWGPVTLQPGDYNLYYGRMDTAGPKLVEVVGKENSTPRVMILAQGARDVSAKQSSLVCIREGNVGIVRLLEMPQLGEAAVFGMPHGAKLTAHKSNGNNNIQIAQGPKLIQRIPITLNSK